MAATICIDVIHDPEAVVLELVPPARPRAWARAERRQIPLYLRRRLAVAAAALFGLLLAFQLAVTGPAAQAGRGAGEPAVSDSAVYVVQPGDTLWSIANALEPGGDVRATVDRLVELNGGAGLEVGQRLRLR